MKTCIAMSRIGMICLLVVLASACRQESQAPGKTQAPSDSANETNASFEPTDPQLVEANNRAVGLMGKFEYAKAREIFEQLTTQNPDWIDAQVNLAIAILNRQQEGDEEAAMEMLKTVLKKNPGHLRAHYCIGLLNLYLQSAEEALPHFETLMKADSNDAYAAYNVGQCLAQMHQYERALAAYESALKLDPYLRSAYWAASQACRALRRDDDAARLIADFEKLERNPRAHTFKFAYSRMGPKGEAAVVNVAAKTTDPVKLPDGPLFLDPVPLLSNGDQYVWKKQEGDRPISITACDIDMDGDIDVFIADALDQENPHNAVCLNDGAGKFTLDADHVLASIPDVNAALWGDYDNDGLTDVYLCRRGPNMLWRQADKNSWRDVTADTQTSNGELDTVDGAMVDFDHDGDLDIFCVNADGPNELLSNNMDGTFRAIAKESGIAGSGAGSRQVLPVDLDGDRDLDIIVVNKQPPHDVWMNDRMWAYLPASGFDSLRKAPIHALIAADTDSDGVPELNAGFFKHSMPDIKGNVQDRVITATWRQDDSGEWRNPSRLTALEDGRDATWSVQVTEISNNGPSFLSVLGGTGYAEVADDFLRGKSKIFMLDDGIPSIRRVRPGHVSFASLAFSGREVTSDNRQVRSNTSGIGVHYAARIDSKWVTGSTLRSSSGPGQLLQPVSIGLGQNKKIDFISIDWPDGVFQTEIDLEAGKLHQIVETQRQLSSCPVIFAWNGEKFRFVTDCLGVGGIGYMVAPGEYAPSRPWENVLLPSHALENRDGKYLLKLSEPMEEACYLDAARLVAYELPPGWKMTLDERMSIMGAEPTGQPIFYREELLPTQATNDRGEDVIDSVLAADLSAAPVGEHDRRFIGRLQNEHSLTLDFDSPLPRGEGLGVRVERAEAKHKESRETLTPALSQRERELVLIIDGWVEYPYSQTMFAAWQANAAYEAPTIEACDAQGNWHIVLEQFGYPAGMPRQMSVPLPIEMLPPDCRKLRIRTNQEIYFDRIAIAIAEPCPDAIRTELPLMQAKLLATGFPRRTDGAQRQPSYDYDSRAALWDTRHQSGMYSAFGRVDELLSAKDDALAIFGAGEEIHMEFQADEASKPQTGWNRFFVLELNGWCKDMDLFTKDGETLEPLPGRQSTQRERLHQQYNTRYESGY